MRLFATRLVVLSALLLPSVALATVSSETSRASYIGNDAVDTYSYPFRIFSNTDLLVTVRDDATPATETTLTLTTDYTVTGVGSASGGTVALVNSGQSWLDGDGDLKTGYTLVIRRVRPITQTTSIKNQGPYYPLLHENAFDHFIMVAQQLKHEISFSIKKRETDEAGDLYIPLEADRASKAFGWDASGDPVAVDYGTVVTNGDGLQAGNNLSDLQDLPTAQSNLGLDTAAYEPVESFEPADPAIQTHLVDTANPHSVTAGQVGNTVAQWNADQIQGNAVAAGTPAAGQLLVWNGLAWVPSDPGPATGGYTSPVEASIDNGQSTAADVGGMLADGSTYSSAEFLVEIERSTSDERRFAVGRVIMTYENNTWSVERALFTGDADGLTFTVNQVGAVGQVQYTSDTMTGTGHAGSVKFGRFSFSH